MISGVAPRNIFLVDESASYATSRNFAPTIDAVATRYEAGDSAVVGFSCDAMVRAEGSEPSSKIRFGMQNRPMAAGTDLTRGLQVALSMAGAGSTVTCITDGMLDAFGKARAMVDQARARGVDVRCVGVGDDAREVFAKVFDSKGQLVHDGWQVAAAL